VQVINAGIHGSGIGDQAIWYDRWVSTFHPHLVILTVFGGNDVCDELHQSQFELTAEGAAVPLDPETMARRGGFKAWLQSVVLKIPGYHFLTQRSHLLYALRTAITAGFSRRSGDANGNCIPREPSEVIQTAIRTIVGEVRWLAQRVQSAGAEFAVVFLPSREVTLDEGPDLAIRAERELGRQLTRATEEAGIPLLDLTEPLGAKHRSDRNGLYFQRDPHMSPAGYRLVGEEVARFLIARHFRPPVSGSRSHN
jgi:lysophospholipase L1-like esterase